MLVEKERVISEKLIVRSRPIPIRSRKIKTQRLAISFKDHIRFLDSGKEFYSIKDLICESIGHNVIITGALSVFHMFLAKNCDCTILVEKRLVEWGNIKLYVSDRSLSFFTTRRGNEWGSIFCDDGSEYGQIDHGSILDTFRDSGWDIDRLMPAGKMSENLIKQKVSGTLLPVFNNGDIEPEHLARAWSAFRGSRMECAALGNFKNVYSIDHNSAFLSVLSELPSVKTGFVKWISSKEYQKDAILGYCLCKTYISEHSPFGLVASRIELKGRRPRLFYNVGESQGWRTKGEIDLIRRSGYGEVEIINGSWAIPVRDSPCPFLGLMHVLQKLMVDPETRHISKMIAATSWGKFASVFEGNTLWNPFYAAEITSRMRVKLAELALSRASDLIAFTIDGVELKKPPIGVPFSSELVGGMRMERSEKLLSLTDFHRFGSKDRTWELQDDGISITTSITLPYHVRFGGEIGEKCYLMKIPFGSSKRRNPNGLSLRTLEQNQFFLPSPTSEECLEMYLNHGDAFLLDI